MPRWFAARAPSWPEPMTRAGCKRRAVGVMWASGEMGGIGCVLEIVEELGLPLIATALNESIGRIAYVSGAGNLRPFEPIEIHAVAMSHWATG